MSSIDAQDPSFGGEAPPSPPPTSRSGCWLGCAILGLTAVLLCAGGGIYLYYSFKSLATDAATFVMKEGIRNSEMRPEDKAAVILEIDRVADAFKEGRITGEELAKIMEKFAESPLMSVLMAYSIQQQIRVSGLSDEEKDQAQATWGRFVRGVVERKISNADFQKAFESVMEVGPNGERRPKQQLSDDDLRKFMTQIEELVDERQIGPGAEYQLDVAAELRKIVDEAAPGKL